MAQASGSMVAVDRVWRRPSNGGGSAPHCAAVAVEKLQWNLGWALLLSATVFWAGSSESVR